MNMEECKFDFLSISLFVIVLPYLRVVQVYRINLE